MMAKRKQWHERQWELAQEVHRHLAEAEVRAGERKMLHAANHGHKFDPSCGQCACGLWLKEYRSKPQHEWPDKWCAGKPYYEVEGLP